jgi:signal transduction histidine kinase
MRRKKEDLMSAAAKGRLFHAKSRLAQRVAPENRSSELDSCPAWRKSFEGDASMNSLIVAQAQDSFKGMWLTDRERLSPQNTPGGVQTEGSLFTASQFAQQAGVETTWTKSDRELSLCLEERRKERSRIARDLHDTLFQGFLGASMLLQSALQEMPANSASKSSLRRALQLMHRVIEEGRTTLQGLRAPAIAPASLEQALANFGNEFATRGVQFRTLVTGHPKALNPAIQEQIYLIGREALANAFRHSKAKRIEAEVEYCTGKLRVVIREDGCGIDLEAGGLPRGSHWGLQGMHERAREIGAEVHIWSKRGLGTEVEISISNERAVQARTSP